MQEPEIKSKMIEDEIKKIIFRTIGSGHHSYKRAENGLDIPIIPITDIISILYNGNYISSKILIKTTTYKSISS